jgi:hypothetical protein
MQFEMILYVINRLMGDTRPRDGKLVFAKLFPRVREILMRECDPIVSRTQTTHLRTSTTTWIGTDAATAIVRCAAPIRPHRRCKAGARKF